MKHLRPASLRFRGGAICAVFLALSTFLGSQLAWAQMPDSLAGIGTLIQQLGTMQQNRSGLSIESGRFTSPVDRARGAGTPLTPPTSGPFDSTAQSNQLQFRLYVAGLQEQVCLGVATDETLRTLRNIGKTSEIELDYCRRAHAALNQFGYDTFNPRVSANAQRLTPTGAVQDDYRLGIGDEVIVTLIGADTRVTTSPVDSEGRVLVPQLRPIPAAGRTLAEFRRDLVTQVAVSFPRSDAFVSIGSIRMVRVSVFGEVHAPGAQTLSALSTLTDALYQAGGVKKTGSLRRIRIERGNQVAWVDIYDLLTGGGLALSTQLYDGDRVIVPALGPTFAISGKVHQPGIFEFPEGKRAHSLRDALVLAGGTLRPQGHKITRLAFDSAGRQTATEIGDLTTPIGEGDLLLVDYSDDLISGTVEITGHVRVPGRRALGTSATIRRLVGDAGALKADPYLPFAALETTDPASQARRYVPVSLFRILAGQEDIQLREGDRLIVLSAEDIRFLTSLDVVKAVRTRQTERGKTAADFAARQQRQQALADAQAGAGLSATQAQKLAAPLATAPALGQAFPQSMPSTAGSAPVPPLAGPTPTGPSQRPGEPSQQGPVIITCKGLDALQAVDAASRTERYSALLSGFSFDQEEQTAGFRVCPAIFDAHEYLLPFVLEHAAVLVGEVRQPGAYPIISGTPLSALAAIAGGLTRGADLTQVEVSRYTPDPYKGTVTADRRVFDVGAQGLQIVAVDAGDVVRFNPLATERDHGAVLLAGEFKRPGLYEIRRSEKLSELIARAGGITPQSYPYGAIFTRESVRKSQQAALRRAAREVNAAILYSAGQKSVNPVGAQQATSVAQQLEEIEAVGRVVIEADLTVLQARPDLDVLLEPGDRLFMPKRPSFVIVVGDVLSPGAQQFIAGKKADQYIRQAGGYQKSADEDRVFVVYPNGEAKPLALSVWNYTPSMVPPGSTIIVPKEPAPFDLYTAVRDTTALVGQIAVTAASLAVINRN